MKKLKIYDLAKDKTRTVTQADIDRLQQIVRAYGVLRQTVLDFISATEEIERTFKINPARPTVLGRLRHKLKDQTK